MEAEVEAHRRRVHRGVLGVGRHREARVEEKLREVRARRAADVDAGRRDFPLEDGDDVRDEEHGEPHDAVDDGQVGHPFGELEEDGHRRAVPAHTRHAIVSGPAGGTAGRAGRRDGRDGGTGVAAAMAAPSLDEDDVFLQRPPLRPPPLELADVVAPPREQNFLRALPPAQVGVVADQHAVLVVVVLVARRHHPAVAVLPVGLLPRLRLRRLRLRLR